MLSFLYFFFILTKVTAGLHVEKKDLSFNKKVSKSIFTNDSKMINDPYPDPRMSNRLTVVESVSLFDGPNLTYLHDVMVRIGGGPPYI